MDKKAKITPGKKSGRTESERRWREGEQKARKERERENENGGSTVFCSLTLKMHFLLHGQFPRKEKDTDGAAVNELIRTYHKEEGLSKLDRGERRVPVRNGSKTK